MANTPYTDPVSKLLALGEADWDEWDDYSELGFTKEHILELIRLGTDWELLVINNEMYDDEQWAPMHAWRILVQMQAVEAIEPLVQILDMGEELDNDMINEGLPEALEKFDAPVIAALAAFMNEPGHSASGYIHASAILTRIGMEHTEHHEHITQIITSALESNFEGNEEEVNGFWISDLLDMNVKNSYPIIKKAFEADKVDITIAGDLEDVEIEWGMRDKRETPAPDRSLFPSDFIRSNNSPRLFSSIPEIPLTAAEKAEVKRDREKIKKVKNKQKQQKKSRKKNQKKK
jgi:hypothetical protein